MAANYPITVLCVEDDPEWQERHREAIEHRVQKLEFASCFEDALHLMNATRPNLILLDLEIPYSPHGPADVGIGGRLLQSIKERRAVQLQEQDVVVISSYADNKLLVMFERERWFHVLPSKAKLGEKLGQYLETCIRHTSRLGSRLWEIVSAEDPSLEAGLAKEVRQLAEYESTSPTDVVRAALYIIRETLKALCRKFCGPLAEPLPERGDPNRNEIRELLSNLNGDVRSNSMRLWKFARPLRHDESIVPNYIDININYLIKCRNMMQHPHDRGNEVRWETEGGPKTHLGPKVEAVSNYSRSKVIAHAMICDIVDWAWAWHQGNKQTNIT